MSRQCRLSGSLLYRLVLGQLFPGPPLPFFSGQWVHVQPHLPAVAGALYLMSPYPLRVFLSAGSQQRQVRRRGTAGVPGRRRVVDRSPAFSIHDFGPLPGAGLSSVSFPWGPASYVRLSQGAGGPDCLTKAALDCLSCKEFSKKKMACTKPLLWCWSGVDSAVVFVVVVWLCGGRFNLCLFPSKATDIQTKLFFLL